MSFMQVRMAMSGVREVGFAGATVLTVEPGIDDVYRFAVRKAVVQPGVTSLGVDWGDDTVEYLTPDSNGEVALVHEYSRPGPKRIRIENKLAEFYPNSNGPSQKTSGPFYVYSPLSTGYTLGRHLYAFILTRVVRLGSNITNRTLSPYLFAHTSITSYPTEYGLPQFTSRTAGSYTIPPGCFADCLRLTSLEGIPTTCRAIESGAFIGCTSLASLTALSSCPICHIGGSAFALCTSLTSLNGLRTITNGDSLTQVLAGTSSTYGLRYDSELNAQYGIYRPTQIVFPVGAYAFYGCTALSDTAGFYVSGAPALPGVFNGCPISYVPFGSSSVWGGRTVDTTSPRDPPMNLQRVDVAMMPARWMSGINVNSDDYLVNTMPGPFGGTSITSDPGSPGIKTIGVVLGGDLSGCSGLTSLDLRGVHHIAGGAFNGCTKLKYVDMSDKTKNQVRALWDTVRIGSLSVSRQEYPWGLTNGCEISCSDGTLIVGS